MRRPLRPLRPLVLAGASLAATLLGIGALSPPTDADATPPACATVGPQLTDYTASVTLPKFDPALGTLTSVTITASDEVTMRIRVENRSPVEAELGGDLAVVGTLEVPSGQTVSSASSLARSEVLPAFDGVLDWSGSGFDTGEMPASNSLDPVLMTSGLEDYIGPGTFTASYAADGHSAFHGPGVSGYLFTSSAGATVCVSYGYEPVPPSTSSTTSTTLPTTSSSTTSTTPPSSSSSTSSSTSTSSTTSTVVTTVSTIPLASTSSSTAPPEASSSTSSVPAETSSSTSSTTEPAVVVDVTQDRPSPSTSPTRPSTPPSTATSSSARPSGRLPRTGTDAAALALVGIGLLGLGASLVAFRRALSSPACAP